jgi:hypothetical protein
MKNWPIFDLNRSNKTRIQQMFKRIYLLITDCMATDDAMNALHDECYFIFKWIFISKFLFF